MDDSRLFIEVLASLPPVDMGGDTGAFPCDLAEQFLGRANRETRGRVMTCIRLIKQDFGIVCNRVREGRNHALGYGLPRASMPDVTAWLGKKGFKV